MSMQGVKFNDIHSYYDLNLILSQCSISPAIPKTNYIEIPGADGSIDVSEALGEIKYKDRTGKLVFSVLPSEDFEEKKSEISNLLNGKHFDRIILDKDPDFYYQGRCSINDWKCDKRIGQITVDLKLHPWKLKINETVIKISGERLQEYEFNLKNSRMPVCPVFKTKFGFDMAVKDAGENDVWYHASDNATVKWLGVQLTEGDNFIEIYPNDPINDEITITYQEGSL